MAEDLYSSGVNTPIMVHDIPEREKEGWFPRI